jgi:hypothetical protein
MTDKTYRALVAEIKDFRSNLARAGGRLEKALEGRAQTDLIAAIRAHLEATTNKGSDADVLAFWSKIIAQLKDSNELTVSSDPFDPAKVAPGAAGSATSTPTPNLNKSLGLRNPRIVDEEHKQAYIAVDEMIQAKLLKGYRTSNSAPLPLPVEQNIDGLDEVYEGGQLLKNAANKRKATSPSDITGDA